MAPHPTDEPPHQHERHPRPEDADRGDREQRRPREPRARDRGDPQRRREDGADREDARHHRQRPVSLLERRGHVERDAVTDRRDEDERDAERPGWSPGSRRRRRSRPPRGNRAGSRSAGATREAFRNRIVATTAVKIGAAPFSMPAIAEFTDPCASGKSVNGIATHVIGQQQQTGPRSARSIRAERAPGTTHSARCPNRIRSQVTSPGRNASSPIAMNRNDEPQIVPTTENSAQSTPANEPRCVPCVVDRTRSTHRLNNDQRQSIVK